MKLILFLIYRIRLRNKYCPDVNTEDDSSGCGEPKYVRGALCDIPGWVAEALC